MARYSIESARQAIQENPDMFEGSRSYFEAIINGTLPEYYRERFQRLKSDYSDDLPSVDVRSFTIYSDRFIQYKCQGNYVVGLCQALNGVIC